jgi:hypothetical protein
LYRKSRKNKNKSPNIPHTARVKTINPIYITSKPEEENLRVPTEKFRRRFAVDFSKQSKY